MYLPILQKNELLYSRVGRFIIHTLISINRGRLMLLGFEYSVISLRFTKVAALLDQQVFNSNELDSVTELSRDLHIPID